MVTTVAPIFFIYVTDFLFGRSERLNFQISHTGPIFTPKLHFLKMPSFFVEVESWPECPQLAIYSSRQSSTSHSEPRSALNSFSALAEKILFSLPHFSYFPTFLVRIL